jgi:hypothetical protein
MKSQVWTFCGLGECWSCPLLDRSGATHAVEAAAVEDILAFTVILIACFIGSMFLEGILSSVAGAGVLPSLPV